MENKQCPACGQQFLPRPQTPHQSYCSAPGCQRQRKKQWQLKKLQNDPDYLDNQNRAQQAWIDRNPDYWRQYRKSHPKYAERNRALQRGRNRQATTRSIAKMDVWIVEITVHACVCTDSVKIAKR